MNNAVRMRRKCGGFSFFIDSDGEFLYKLNYFPEKAMSYQFIINQ